ncbi:MAG: PHP domain-containing protein [Deltaproteobacteria bacterium]|nr:PHP domain-containing protein [Deltaproteobacteria bacterium]
MSAARPAQREDALYLQADRLPETLPRWECHLHTRYTDGKMTVAQAVDRAIEIGLERLIFTEHTEDYKAQSPDWFRAFAADIERARARVGDRLTIILGLETPAIDFEGGLDLSEEMADRVEYVLGAAHRYPHLDGRVRDLSHAQGIELETRTLRALIDNPQVHAIAHPGATCEKYCGPFPLDRFEELVGRAVEQGVGIDLNARYHRREHFAICSRLGARILPGSDAHIISEIGKCLDWLEGVRDG